MSWRSAWVHVQQLQKVLITFWDMVLRKRAGNLYQHYLLGFNYRIRAIITPSRLQTAHEY